MKGCRIVLTTFGSLGDLHPYLALARELRSRGHFPVLATSGAYREKVEADGVEFSACRPDETDFGDPAEVLAKANHPLFGTPYVIRRLILPWLRETVADLEKVAQGAELIVAHPLGFAAPIVAEGLRIPWVGTLLQPMGYLSAFDPPHLPGIGRLPFSPAVNRRIFSGLGFLLRRWLSPLRRIRAEKGLGGVQTNPVLCPFSPWLNLGLFSPRFGPPQPDWPKNAKATGWIFYDEGGVGYEKPDPRLGPFLDEGPGPLVFTLGSTIVRNPGSFFGESLGAAQELGLRAVLVTGRENPEPRNLPSNLLAVPYAPYGWLFPRASLVVHHGGAGTTAQALRAGKPQLVVPRAHDQPDHAGRVVRLGCGACLRPKRYRARSAATQIRRLLSDAATKANAQEVGEAVRAEAGALRAADELEALLPR